MAKVKCYDPKGKEYLKESIDARECVKILGFTMDVVSPEVVTGIPIEIKKKKKKK